MCLSLAVNLQKLLAKAVLRVHIPRNSHLEYVYNHETSNTSKGAINNSILSYWTALVECLFTRGWLQNHISSKSDSPCLNTTSKFTNSKTINNMYSSYSITIIIVTNYSNSNNRNNNTKNFMTSEDVCEWINNGW